jgi:23S rRNA (adenine2030-N6)-methyltransferase
MNYRHGFHAGNHADVLKHVILLMLVEALKAKPSPFFVLDTHAGRGRYLLGGEQSQRTGEAATGILRLAAHKGLSAPLKAYVQAVKAGNPVDGLLAYPGSPMLVAQALREGDRLAACELQSEEAQALKTLFAGDPKVAVHARDGYGAIKALLPPRIGQDRFARGLVLIDPPYEAQNEEYPLVCDAVAECLQRWPAAMVAVWYPIKQRRSLQPFYRRVASLPARGTLAAELLVHPDDSPLRLNGSGMLLFNPPWQLDKALAPVMKTLDATLGETGGSHRVDWLRQPE